MKRAAQLVILTVVLPVLYIYTMKFLERVVLTYVARTRPDMFTDAIRRAATKRGVSEAEMCSRLRRQGVKIPRSVSHARRSSML